MKEKNKWIDRINLKKKIIVTWASSTKFAFSLPKVNIQYLPSLQKSGQILRKNNTNLSTSRRPRAWTQCSNLGLHRFVLRTLGMKAQISTQSTTPPDFLSIVVVPPGWLRMYCVWLYIVFPTFISMPFVLCCVFATGTSRTNWFWKNSLQEHFLLWGSNSSEHPRASLHCLHIVCNVTLPNSSSLLCKPQMSAQHVHALYEGVATWQGR